MENQTNEHDVQVQKLKLKRDAIEGLVSVATTAIIFFAIVVILAMKWGVA